MTKQQFHLTPWLVMRCTAECGFKEIARYRYRGDAEAHAQKLQRMLPGYFMVAFEQPEVISR
ncbi:hypothetical protein [Nostoc sp. NMS4]|uniref:hypothetical protein n=1 Tax=Nostoc sp. NMS4 TaxID=2815390 RepID=UPI0025DEB2D0|nr:hypothetical protein [Nostoc sp. NMS4]MBN3924024.1 hypothetical protein [Nostoc sp. NMS4]